MNIHQFFKMGNIGEPIQLTDVVLALPMFDRILQYHGENRNLAINEIKYILWKYTWNSPYNVIPEELREKRLLKDMFGKDDYLLSDIAKASAKCYVEEFQTNEVLEMLYAARDGIAFLRNSFRDVKNGESDMKPLEAVRTVNLMGQTLASLELVIKAAQKREEAGNEFTVRGGGEIGLFEE